MPTSMNLLTHPIARRLILPLIAGLAGGGAVVMVAVVVRRLNDLRRRDTPRARRRPSNQIESGWFRVQGDRQAAERQPGRGDGS